MSTNACRGSQEKVDHMNRSVLALLLKAEAYSSPDKVARAEGFCPKHYQRKKERPDSFTIANIRSILRDEISNAEILAMFGRKE